MKTTQVLAAAAWLFPLASLAQTASSSSTTTPTSSSTSTTSSDEQLQTTPGELRGWKNLGCFQVAGPGEEDLENPLSSDETGTKSPTRSFNSVGVCVFNLCSSYEYAAVTDGVGCYCAPAMHPGLEQVGDELCDVVCPGWSEETCGGKGYLQIYENLDPDVGKPGTTFDSDESSLTPSSTAPPGTDSGGGASDSGPTSSSGAPAASSSVPAAANSNAVAQSVAWLAAGAGLAFFL